MDSYVSNKLCHFVGRSLVNDNDRFKLLIQIITEGKLRANINNPDEPSVASTWEYSGERLGEVFKKCDCVCFCDIPDDMLGIHTQKYGKFGIAFSKAFLVKAGVRPVTYVPSHERIKECAKTGTPVASPAEYFAYLSNLSNTLLPLLILLNQYDPISDRIVALTHRKPAINKVLQALDGKIVAPLLAGEMHPLLYSLLSGWATQLAYIKVFDETLDDDDPDNYYMEREWRSIGSVDFSVGNIEKVYLPSAEFVDRFKKVFPMYNGEFYILP